MVDPWQYGVQDTDLSVPADRSSQGTKGCRRERRQPASSLDDRLMIPDHGHQRQISQVMLVSTDKAFAQDTRAAFAASDVIQLVTVEKSVSELRGEIQEADCGAVIIDMDAARLEEIEALQRITRRLEDKAPIVVVTQEFNAAAVRILVQLEVAELPGEAATTGRSVRSCIRALQGRAEDDAEFVHTFIPAAAEASARHAPCRTASSCTIR